MKHAAIFLVGAALVFLLLVVVRLSAVDRRTADRACDPDSRRADRSGDPGAGGRREGIVKAVDSGEAEVFTNMVNMDTASYWVYLGQFSGKGNRWLCKNFDVRGVPTKGQEIIALADLFVWDDLPYLRSGNWKLGMIMGLVPTSVPVLVVKVQEIRSGIYWALIRQ